MRVLPLLFICTCFSGHATNYFIAPGGSDSSPGSVIDLPLATIQKGFELAEPGDTLFLLPGRFTGSPFLEKKSGNPDLPIVLRSWAVEPENFAVIDGGSNPSLGAEKPGIQLKNCSWISIENIVFRNCWRHVIALLDSEYITIRSCHFTTGKEIVYPRGNGSHHILVEHCFVQHPDEVWQGWDWGELHHGELEYYNGGLLHPRESGGGHVMRHNVVKNLFNGFRTRPSDIRQDGNIEIYRNTFENIRDNDFEPEGWAWNIHYYYNRHLNVHKAYSIDDVRGGNIYIYGNTYTQTKDAWALDEVSGIFKYKNGPLTYPCYAFNNSYYTEAKVLKEGESTNHLLKHFNNAYFFFRGSQRFRLDEWQTGFEFDYDLINQDFPGHIYNNNQETNGLVFTDPLFVNGEGGDFRLQPGSPALDAGKVMQLAAFDWIQRHGGTAPDIGAYEGEHLVDGPPFRFIPSPDGSWYQERPRISRHWIDSNELTLYFSAPLDTNSLSNGFIQIFEKGRRLEVDTFYFPSHPYELIIRTNTPMTFGKTSILFTEKPIGLNELPLTDWASTIPIGTSITPAPDLSEIQILTTSVERSPNDGRLELEVTPNPASESVTFVLTSSRPGAHGSAPRLAVYSISGVLLERFLPTTHHGNQWVFQIDKDFHKGMYVGVIQQHGKFVSAKFIIH